LIGGRAGGQVRDFFEPKTVIGCFSLEKDQSQVKNKINMRLSRTEEDDDVNCGDGGVGGE
jgi:hypothetical protein